MNPDDIASRCDCFLLIEYSGMINDIMATGNKRTMSAKPVVAKSTYGLLSGPAAYMDHGSGTDDGMFLHAKRRMASQRQSQKSFGSPTPCRPSAKIHYPTPNGRPEYCLAPMKRYTAPRTVDELHNALTALGVDVTGRLSCGLLSAIRKNIVSVSGSQNYVEQQNRYWSAQQQETLPACRVTPKNAVDVAISLLVTKYLDCPFAVKSGGHAAFAGASNIQGGLAFDLSSLRQVEVSRDRAVTKVGAGNRWVDVYSKLDPLGLSVIGGRVADIGVGGLTLGELPSKISTASSLLLTLVHVLTRWFSQTVKSTMSTANPIQISISPSVAAATTSPSSLASTSRPSLKD
ncbi:MAG: hypothetical protein Q9215_003501 [Flavoplaca cf. flavocitrina]